EGSAVDDGDRDGGVGGGEACRVDGSGHGGGEVDGHDGGGAGVGGGAVGVGEAFGGGPGGGDGPPFFERLRGFGGGDVALVPCDAADGELQGHDPQPVAFGEAGREVGGGIGDDRDRAAHARTLPGGGAGASGPGGIRIRTGPGV